MKTSFTNITSAWWSSVLVLALCASSPLHSFQLEAPPGAGSSAFQLSDFEKMEAGQATEGNVSPTFFYLAVGRYEDALRALTLDVELVYPWMRSYLEGVIPISNSLEKRESQHFVLFLPKDQLFLAGIALPSLEKAATAVEKIFGHRAQGKIRVEIYPSKEAFSAASTLSMETLERSGAIGICKFHRMMILSPRALPLGYRWLDALSHEYMHLTINELSNTKAELWLHEGTARYFETAYRATPPVYLTPGQKTALKDAQEKDTLIPFARMSPSMVYLKNQDEVSLAFAQVSYAVDKLIQEKSGKKFVGFLQTLKKKDFAKAFSDSFGWDLPAFGEWWQAQLKGETWEKTKGALSDEVRFEAMDENDVVGADVQGRLRIADRMRKQGHIEAALIEYEKALKEEPDNGVLLLKAARTHLALGQENEAREKLKWAVQKNPNYVTIRIELAKLLPQKEAMIHLEEAKAINPFDPGIAEILQR